jgi:hypothetical protein
LHLGIFDQPEKIDFSSTLLDAVPHSIRPDHAGRHEN